MLVESLSVLTDEELYDHVKNDDERAYTELYERFKRPLLVYALKKIKEEEAAEDIVHDVFVKLWVNRSKIELKGRFVGYIFKALRNRIIDHFARSTYAQQYLDSLESYSEQMFSSPADYKVREDSFWENIEQLLDKHSVNAPTIVRLRMDGYNNHEIAAHLNVSEKTVRNKQSTIIKYLKSKFTQIMVLVCLLLFLLF
ncbi:sigma-70 family RNA polymerase sigma factor [Olivibacter sp. CPCC 100613]|uniref:RNA polymerase sigma factor n=1 Tax=Olivibacter sp. CPCC 100613 TaxID=3079931 RepID=UPI002FFB0C97